MQFHLGLEKQLCRKKEETETGCKTKAAGWWLAQQRAKQKAFVTLLALAPSPAF
jgi:hypothetical protein